MELRPYPPCSLFKSMGMIVMGFWAAEVLANIVPSLTEDDWRSSPLYSFFCWFSAKILYTTGGLTGIYLVANIGKTRCDLDDLLMGYVYSLPFLLSGGDIEWALLFVGLKARFSDLKVKEIDHGNNSEINAEARFMYDCAVYCLASVIWFLIFSIGLHLNAGVIVKELQIRPSHNIRIHRIPFHEGMPEVKASTSTSRNKYCLSFSRYDSMPENGEWPKMKCFFHVEKDGYGTTFSVISFWNKIVVDGYEYWW